MAKESLTLDNGTICSSWNYCGARLAAISAKGTLSIFDFRDPASSSSLGSTSKFKVPDGNIVKIVWVPPEYGDIVACISANGIASLWEEVVEDSSLLNGRFVKALEVVQAKSLMFNFGYL